MGQHFIKAKRSIKRHLIDSKTNDETRKNRSARVRGLVPHFDKAKALWLLITVKLLPPQFSWGAFTPAGRPEVPSSPTTRILFASVSTYKKREVAFRYPHPRTKQYDSTHIDL
jgi:hypothetical protein